jgi:peptide/nickel transport system permease protein
MARYIVRRLATLVLTMLLVSIVVFGVVEIAPGNVARNILGAYATPEQEKSMENQLGLDRPAVARYFSWLVGSDWRARSIIGMPVREIVVQQGTQERFRQWWAVEPGTGQFLQWKIAGQDLVRLVRQEDGSTIEVPDNDAWTEGPNGEQVFWGVDTGNRIAQWVKGQGGVEYRLEYSGWIETAGSPVEYIPLSKGLVRGDFGLSLQYKRPVGEVIGRRVANSAVLAMLAFLVAMPLGVLLGLIAGLNGGKPVDRALTLGGLVTTASPDFATGILLIMIFSMWLGWLPGATVYTTGAPVWSQPKMLILPVLTASLAEIGYILRITRSSVLEVMNTGYVRTAILKGLPYRRTVFSHVLRNSLMAPVTVIMLHVNWLIGGLVVVESVFGFPGLGNFILNAALYKDVYAIEAGAMVLVVFAVGSQLIADIVYSFLNPRIRYA